MEVIDDFLHEALNLARDGMVPEYWVDSTYIHEDSDMGDRAEMVRARLWIDENPWEDGVEPIVDRLNKLTGIEPTCVTYVGSMISFYWLDETAQDLADKFNL